MLVRSFDTLNIDQLILLAETYTDLGQFDKAENIIAHIFDLKVPDILIRETLQTKAELIRARIGIYKRDSNRASMSLSNAAILTEGLGNAPIKATTLYHFGVFYLMQEDYQESLDYLHKALELIIVNNNPKLVAKIYLRMADAHVHNLNLEQASYYMDRGRELIMKLQNSYDIAWYANKTEISLHNQQLFNQVHQNLEACAPHVSQAGSVKELQYHLENMGRYLLFDGKEAEAHSILLKAEKLDHNYRPDAVFNYSTAIRLFIESKHDYTKSIAQMEKTITRASNFRPDTLKHILATTRFLHAPGHKERKSGEQELKRLSEEGKSKLMQKVAMDTLVKKQLQPYR